MDASSGRAPHQGIALILRHFMDESVLNYFLKIKKQRKYDCMFWRFALRNVVKEGLLPCKTCAL